MRSRVLDGSGLPTAERVTLRAGKLTLDYKAGMVRYIRLGNHEVVRGIYAAVRDHTHEQQIVIVNGIGGTFKLKSLDETTADRAIRDSEGYCASPGEQIIVDAAGLVLNLLPYAVVRLDQSS